MTLPEVLRKETQALHQFLEQSPLLHQLTSDNLTIDAYLQVLVKFYSYFSALEEQVNNYKNDLSGFLPDLDQRRKANLLALDFYALQGKRPPEQPVSIKNTLPEIHSASQALGCLYVMEGSTLGGTFIAKHVNKKLGLTAEAGHGFFSGYGKNTGEKWSAFKQALIKFSEKNPGQETLVVEAANQTFSGFSTWLSC